MQEEERSDWQKLIFFDPSGTVLLHALRRIAFPEAAVFSDKLVNVCATLSRGGEVNLDALHEDPWAQVETCVANLQAGLAELRGMQKSIERHTKQQLAATSLKENLALLYDQFAERIGRTCYAQLVHSRLPTKLSETHRALESLSSHADLLRPEIFARVNEKLVFRRLGYEHQLEIAEKFIAREIEFLRERGHKLELDKTVLPFLVRKGFHPKLGARPMRDAVEKLVGDAVSECLLQERPTSGALTFDEMRDCLMVL